MSARKDIQHYNPDEGSMRIHSLEAAEKVAHRIKDWGRLGEALRAKLEEEAQFAAHYRALFPLGINQHSGSDRTVQPNLDGPTFCQSHGFHDRTVRRWGEALLGEEEQRCVLAEDKLEAVWEARLPRAAKVALMEQAANYSSESVEWYTPGRYIDAVRDVFDGTIDLDPASSSVANETVGAAKFFTEKDNGLLQDWWGRVFLNPPYGQTDDRESVAGLFCQKAIDEYEKGAADEVIILVNSVHSQRWQAPLYQFPVCFVDHRIQFISGDGTENKNPTFQNIFVYLGAKASGFAQIFSELGYVMARYA